MKRAVALASIVAVLFFSQVPLLCFAQTGTFQSEAEVAASLQFVPPEAVPEYGTFYFLSAQLDETLPDIPLPWDPYEGTQPIYAIDLTNNVFLIADSPADYLNLTGEATGETIYREGDEMSAMDEGSEGGLMSLSFEPDELGLELAALTNGTACLTVHPPASETADGVYDLYSTATLGTNWLWVLRTDPGQTNVVVPNLTADQCYFILGRTNDTDGDGMSDALEQLVSHSNPNNADEDSNGIPDGWEWSQFGSLQPGNTDYDGDGKCNLAEYQAGTDPNTISFSIDVTNQYVNVGSASLQLDIARGVPSSMAVLVDSTNLSEAAWTIYTANPTVELGTAQGWHDVWIGLRGRLTTSEQSWQWTRLKLDITPPQLVITNPGSSTVMQPVIEVQGFCPEALASLSYDLTNAKGLVTNQPAYVIDQLDDTNTWEFTTNWFQAFDVELTNGVNTFTFYAIDLAGNVTTTNITFILDYSAKTNPPLIRLYWPQDGTRISGTNTYTWRGCVDDFTAKVTATLVDTNGNTNTYQGLAERDGNFWVENLPAPIGTNWLQLDVQDVVGNASSTNILVVNSPLKLTMDPLEVAADQSCTNVTGTIDSTNFTLWVNGVKAWLNGDGSWIASNAPVTPGGTAVFQARAIPNSDNGGNGDGGGGDTANPNSSLAVDLESQGDKPMSVFLASCITNHSYIDQSHTDVYDRPGGSLKYYYDDQYTENSSLRWHNVGTASANFLSTDDYWYPGGPGIMREDIDEIIALDSWPEPSTKPYRGTELYTRYWNHQLYFQGTFPLGPPAVGKEYRVTRERQSGSGEGWKGSEYCVGSWQWQRTCAVRSKVKLFAGGKGFRGPKSVFALSAWAARRPGGPPLQAFILGHPDEAYVVLNDHATIDVTPTASANWYIFDVGASKHTPYIRAGGVDLRTTTPEFCVGQGVTFALDWENESPPNVVDTVSQWHLPDKFVNEEYPYSSTCTSYRRNNALLLNTASTSCWFVNGSGGAASIGINFHFSNGQYVSMAAMGSLNIYRPAIWLGPYQPGQQSPYYTISYDNIATCKLKLGENDETGDGTMQFDVNINSKISGSIGLTQLITANYANPAFRFSEERCDGSEFYDGPNSVNARTDSLPSGLVTLQDGPSSVWTSPNWVDLSCRDFVRFKPNGGVWVTLGIVTWETVGMAQTFMNEWDIAEDATSGPNGPDRSDEFPLWTINQGGMH